MLLYLCCCRYCFYRERVRTCLSLAPGSYFSELPRCGEGGLEPGGTHVLHGDVLAGFLILDDSYRGARKLFSFATYARGSAQKLKAVCAAAQAAHAPPRQRCLWSTLCRKGFLLNVALPPQPLSGPSVRGGRFRRAKTTADTCLGGSPGPLSPEKRSCCRCVCCVFRFLEVVHPNFL